MAEGTRAMDNDTMRVTEIRLGNLDADGSYTETGALELMIFKYELDLSGDTAVLTLYNEDGSSREFYPFDMDSPEEADIEISEGLRAFCYPRYELPVLPELL
jgi:hypothetical protein